MVQAFSVDRYLTIRTLSLKVAHGIECFKSCFSWTHFTGGGMLVKNIKSYWNGNAFCGMLYNGLLYKSICTTETSKTANKKRQYRVNLTPDP